jgi:phosphate/sulfate permease
MGFFEIAIIVLVALAVADLMVGVSNDAVNFLNSAIGSNVASFRVIMIVATVGIILGATFSSGMMEVARKGIFHPDLFSFAEIMIVFLAVMLSDVVLLDLFNTYGLPTSTTVSIVFELLGAAVAVALISTLQAGGTLAEVMSHINSGSALTIIVGILLSVVIAFSAGTIVQFLSRLLFTFRYEQRLRRLGGVWGGLAMTALAYFLLVKGLSGASFVDADVIRWIDTNTVPVILGLFVASTAVAQVLLWRGVNVLRVVVLFGTFALAMAFAGNDLVNFIGVPIAGLSSFQAWSASGQGPEALMMEALQAPVQTSTWLLLIAGLIMAITLWLSRKARSVTDTEVNLARQEEGYERFTPNGPARLLVRGAVRTSSALRSFSPSPVTQWVGERFEMTTTNPADDRPAFDLLRASVNLTVASILIAIATSMKLPLSTTYVTFMVAMGTSLADRAWGRESAVYRVSGVLNVIGGWFLTAVGAFTMAALSATLLLLLGAWALAGLVLLAGIAIVRGFVVHRVRTRREKERQHVAREVASCREAVPLASASAARVVERAADAYEHVRKGLLAEDDEHLRRATTLVRDSHDAHGLLRRDAHRLATVHLTGNGTPSAEPSPTEPGCRTFYTIYEAASDLQAAVATLTRSCREYVRNSHEPPTGAERQHIERTMEATQALLRTLHHSDDLPAAARSPHVREQAERAQARVDAMIEAIFQHRSIAHQPTTDLLLTLVVETRTVIEAALRFGQVQHAGNGSATATAATTSTAGA